VDEIRYTEGLKMNVLDKKIDDMIRQYPEYAELRVAADQLLRVMSRSAVISFLKYAETVKKAA